MRSSRNNGDYNFADCPPPKTKLYKDSINACIDLEKVIIDKLEPDGDLLEKCLDAYSEMFSERVKQAYVEGFSIGLRLAVEAFDLL